MSTVGPIPEINARFHYREEDVDGMNQSDDVMLQHGVKEAHEVTIESPTQFHHLFGRLLGRRDKNGCGSALLYIVGKGKTRRLTTLQESNRGIIQCRQQCLLWLITARSHPPMQGSVYVTSADLQECPAGLYLIKQMEKAIVELMSASTVRSNPVSCLLN